MKWVNKPESEVPRSSLVPDFFKEGGLVFVSNPFDHIVLTSNNISTYLISKFYAHMNNQISPELTLDDIADWAMKNQIIP